MANIEDLRVNVKLNYDCLDMEDIGLISGLLKSEYEKTHSDIMNKRISKAQEHFKEAINCDVDIPKPVNTTVKTFPEFYAKQGVVYQRVTNDNKEFLRVGNREQGDRFEIAEQIVDLLNSGTIKIEEI